MESRLVEVGQSGSKVAYREMDERILVGVAQGDEARTFRDGRRGVSDVWPALKIEGGEREGGQGATVGRNGRGVHRRSGNVDIDAERSELGEVGEAVEEIDWGEADGIVEVVGGNARRSPFQGLEALLRRFQTVDDGSQRDDVEVVDREALQLRTGQQGLATRVEDELQLSGDQRPA